MTSNALTWVGIGVCLIHSGLFSGLNLSLLGLSRLQLEVESKSGNKGADRILALRRDSNLLLTTILWGNVGANCLLTLLSDSIMVGIGAFLFSTVGITIAGEILPQAYFSRNAMRVGAALTPFIRFYQKVFWVFAKPTALLLDKWLGTEEISYFRERELREVIRQHMVAEDADLDHHEGLGALNFLVLDDLPVAEEGEPVDPRSVIALPIALDLPVFPAFSSDPQDEFLQRIQASGHKWVVITDTDDQPRVVLDADAFLRDAIYSSAPTEPYTFCHRPLVVENPKTALGKLIRRLRVEPESEHDDVIDKDLILLWGSQKRIVTGADLLGRLLRGIVKREASSGATRASLGTQES